MLLGARQPLRWCSWLAQNWQPQPCIVPSFHLGFTSGVRVPWDEMKARYVAGVCLFCASREHQRKGCRAPKSMTLTFALLSALPEKIPRPDDDKHADHLLRSLSDDDECAWQLATDHKQAILQNRCNHMVIQVQYRLVVLHGRDTSDASHQQ